MAWFSFQPAWEGHARGGRSRREEQGEGGEGERSKGGMITRSGSECLEFMYNEDSIASLTQRLHSLIPRYFFDL